jgi:hypothetical protein
MQFTEEGAPMDILESSEPRTKILRMRGSDGKCDFFLLSDYSSLLLCLQLVWNIQQTGYMAMLNDVMMRDNISA